MSEDENIKVLVRVRPLNDRETKEGAKPIVIFNQSQPQILTLDSQI